MSDFRLARECYLGRGAQSLHPSPRSIIAAPHLTGRPKPTGPSKVLSFFDSAKWHRASAAVQNFVAASKRKRLIPGHVQCCANRMACDYGNRRNNPQLAVRLSTTQPSAGEHFAGYSGKADSVKLGPRWVRTEQRVCLPTITVSGQAMRS